MLGKSQGDIVRDLLAQGRTVEEIMQITGLSRASVAQYKMRREKSDAQKKQSKRQIAREMFKNGATVKEVMEQTGLAYNSARKYKNELEIEADRPIWRYEWPLSLQIDWVITVNVIREKRGLKPMPMPGE